MPKPIPPIFLAALLCVLAAACKKPSGSSGARIEAWDASVLLDQQGKPMPLQSIRAPYKLVYFGYTRCTESCPVALASMSMAKALLGSRARRLALIFITIDPTHDTPTRLRSYLSSFAGPPIIGLSASRREWPALILLARGFGIGVQKSESSDSKHSSPSKRGQQGHPIAHTPFLYLLDSENRRIANYSAGISARALRNELMKFL